MLLVCIFVFNMFTTQSRAVSVLYSCPLETRLMAVIIVIISIALLVNQNNELKDARKLCGI